jgi:hypothetical protein
MNDNIPAIEMFQTRVRQELPELAASVGDPVPDGYGNFILLDVPCPSNPDRCRLGVLFCGECFEISFSVVETRGPAECQIHLGSDLASSVSETIRYLHGILTGGILVDVFRYRWFWFQPYYLAFFREASCRPRGNIVQTLSWKDCGKSIDAPNPLQSSSPQAGRSR